MTKHILDRQTAQPAIFTGRLIGIAHRRMPQRPSLALQQRPRSTRAFQKAKHFWRIEKALRRQTN